MVHRHPPILCLAPLEQRHVLQEGEGEYVWVVQLKPVRQLAPQPIESAVGDRRPVGDKQQHIATLRAGDARHLFRLLDGEVLRDR